ncbi:tetratricopeptide repeat protein [Rhodocaloribacter litoris]|uniref:tetratricopeptide repeat protein n=1 Tax=Rhodocaloribacter litoris TaxID=2558931 RepID=UPI001E37860D|nr:tetratricopeptide repeat protein [Rhodocaloribacter litoris]QXD16948.1 tetratricopeptide repeat protein [Rhodocaloribacter litoris]
MKANNLGCMRFSILVLCLCMAAPPVVHAQDAIEWWILNREAMDLYAAGNYDRAVAVAQKALEVAEQNFGLDHPDVAATLHNLAFFYVGGGRLRQGRAALQALAGDLGESAGL